MAACSENAQVTAFLITKGISVNAKRDFDWWTSNGDAALHDAVACRSKEIVEMMLNNGADINARDSKGRTALHRAARRDQ